MIGTNLNLVLPLVSDTMAAVVAKTAAALSAIEVSIADDATQAAINITAPLSLGGNWLSDAGGVILADGNAPSAAGGLYYHAGEFYMIDSTSAIKVTLNGNLNVTGIGAIGGDYGGANPALVSYDTISGQYRFYINGGTLTWADLSARSLIMHGASGSVEFTVDSSVVTAQTYPIGNFTSEGALIWNGSVLATGNTVTTDWHCDVVHCTGLYHTDSWEYQMEFGVSDGASDGKNWPAENGGLTVNSDSVTAGLGGGLYRFPSLSMLRVGDTIVGFKMRENIAASFTAYLYVKTGSAAATLIGSIVGSGTGSETNYTWSPFTTHTIVSGERCWFEVALGSTGDAIYNASVFATH